MTWGRCPFLTVLQPVCLLQLWKGEAPAVIPSSPCASHPPQLFFKGVPSQDGWWERGGWRDTAGAFTWHCRNSRVPALTGVPWDHSRTSPGAPAVQGRDNEHQTVCVNPTSIHGYPWAGVKPHLPAATEAALQGDFSPE